MISVFSQRAAFLVALQVAALNGVFAVTVCDNGLTPGDVVVTAFNTEFTNDESKPVVVMTSLKFLPQGTEIFLSDRPLLCPTGGGDICDFLPLDQSEADGTAKFTAYQDIPAGSTIAFSKYRKPYSADNLYFYEGFDRGFADNWDGVTWTDPAQDKTKQFNLWSKSRGVDSSSNDILTGDNIHVYCLSGTNKVMLFSLLYSDNVAKTFIAAGGDLHEGKGAASKVASVNTMAPPGTPKLLLTPATVNNTIPVGEASCACEGVGNGAPLNGYTCTDGSSGQCQSDEICNSVTFAASQTKDGCGTYPMVATNWEDRNHWRLKRPACGLTKVQYIAYATDPVNWMYNKDHSQMPRITSFGVTDPYEPGYCAPYSEDAAPDLSAQFTEQSKIEEALIRSTENRISSQTSEAVNIEYQIQYQKLIQEYIQRGSRFFPDGVTPIPGNEYKSTEAIDPRLPACFGVPDCPDGKPIGVLEDQAAAFEHKLNPPEDLPPNTNETVFDNPFEPTASPTRSPTPAPTAGLKGPRLLGCFRDAAQRALKHNVGSGMSVSRCNQVCSSQGYRFSGLQYFGECYCDNNGYDKYGQLEDSACDCYGPCVGGWRNCVFYLRDGPVPGNTQVKNSKLTTDGALDLLVDAGGTAQTAFPP